MGRVHPLERPVLSLSVELVSSTILSVLPIATAAFAAIRVQQAEPESANLFDELFYTAVIATFLLFVLAEIIGNRVSVALVTAYARGVLRQTAPGSSLKKLVNSVVKEFGLRLKLFSSVSRLLVYMAVAMFLSEAWLTTVFQAVAIYLILNQTKRLLATRLSSHLSRASEANNLEEDDYSSILRQTSLAGEKKLLRQPRLLIVATLGAISLIAAIVRLEMVVESSAILLLAAEVLVLRQSLGVAKTMVPWAYSVLSQEEEDSV